MKEILKKSIPYVAALAIFIILSLIYASPEVFDGKVLQAGDQISGKGMVNEVAQYHGKTGGYSFWTGSMFCGMPTYQIGGYKYPTPAVDIPYGAISHLGFVGLMALFMGYFIGFFIMLRAFKVNEWLSIVGAVAITLSTYFMLIIPAGHNAKVIALGLLAPIIGGFYLIYRKKYGWGAIITMIYTSVGIMSHPQMTYYIFMLIGVLFVAELFIHIREKRWKDLGIGTLIFVASFGIGISTQITPFMANREYAKETMRGGHSELVKDNDATNKTEGLDISYITQYSYGIGETSTLLIPGSRGYASHYDVGDKSHVHDALVQKGIPKRAATEICKYTPTYWGGEEGTSGPVYVGAIVCFLFVLGLLIVKSPYKWALLAATIFSVLLAWGYNFMPLQEFFAHYFPMYTKFRAVESILVVAEITMPLLGFLALNEIMSQKRSKTFDKKKLIKNIYISAGITAGLCILALIATCFMNFTRGDIDIKTFENFINNFPGFAEQFPDWKEWYPSAVIADRAAIYRTSAFRSLMFVLLGAAAVWLYTSEKMKFGFFVAILGTLVLVDMWTINRKFFNDDNFTAEKSYKSYFAEQPWEKEILSRESNNTDGYRVYNIIGFNSFNDARSSYRFKSIGGYNAAKLRRYQDIIDAHIGSYFDTLETRKLCESIRIPQNGTQGILLPDDKAPYPVLNMLNMKYLVYPGQNGQWVLENPNAMGNAWFVDSVVIANTPQEESDALDKINLRNTLVTDVKFKEFVKDFRPHHDSSATIKLTKYAPDYVEYDYTAKEKGTVVFSEIYYPYGWNAYIDGKPAEHFRANYTLRALNVPAGQHHIRFEFRPATVEKWGKVSIASKYVMNLTILCIIGLAIYKSVRRRKEETI